ncbi:MAG: hypothetical protein HOP19_14155, partial [Acidobacteria bacterium]|nr:hypothetical protein [Acidobacteriota bacterium]
MITELLLSALTEIPGIVYGEVLGGRADAWSYEKFCQLRDNLAQLRADANHDLERAAHTAYWQAALQLLGERAEQLGLNADQLLKGEIFTNALGKLGAFSQQLSQAAGMQVSASSPENWAKYLREQLSGLRKLRQPSPSLSIGPEAGSAAERQFEKDWLERAILECWALLADLQAGRATLPEAAAEREFERLLQREGSTSSEKLAALRADMTRQMQADFVQQFGQPSAPLRQMIETKWFDYYRGAFHVFIKTDPKVARMLQSEMLARLLFAPTVTTQALQAALNQLNTDFTRRLSRIATQLANLPVELHTMLAPLALATERTEQFFLAIQNQLTVIVQQGNKTHEKLDELKGIVSGTSSVPRAVELAYLDWLEQKYELANTDRYTPLKGEARAKPRVEMKVACSLRRIGQSRELETPEEVQDAIAAMLESRRVILLGEPGGGKTTTLQKLAAQLIEAARTNPQEPLPLLIA